SVLGGPTSAYLVANGSGTKVITGFGSVSKPVLADAVNASQGSPTCGGAPCPSGGGSGGSGGGSTKGLAIAPSSLPNDYDSHPVVITGPLTDFLSAWVTMPGTVDSSTCVGEREDIQVTSYVSASEIDGTLSIGNTCIPGAYDLNVQLHHSDGSRETLVCSACLTVTAASTIRAVTSGSVPNDGTDGYVHTVTL